MPLYTSLPPAEGRRRLRKWRGAAFRAVGLLALTLVGCMLGLLMLDDTHDPWGTRAFNALWNSANTITTMGDFTTLNQRQQVFMIGAMFTLVTIGGYAISTLTGVLSGNAVQAYREYRRVEKKLADLTGHCVVAGFGVIGRRVANRLRQQGRTVVVVEFDEAQANQASDLGYLTVLLLAGRDEALPRPSGGTPGDDPRRGSQVGTDPDRARHEPQAANRGRRRQRRRRILAASCRRIAGGPGRRTRGPGHGRRARAHSRRLLSVGDRPTIFHPDGWQLDGERMSGSVQDLRPRVADSEKITINLGFVDLGRIDLLVAEGFYANRTDLIRTAIRNQLDRDAEAVKGSVARRRLDLGLRHYTRADLEAARDAGMRLDIHVLGLAHRWRRHAGTGGGHHRICYRVGCPARQPGCQGGPGRSHRLTTRT